MRPVALAKHDVHKVYVEVDGQEVVDVVQLGQREHEEGDTPHPGEAKAELEELKQQREDLRQHAGRVCEQNNLRY